MAEKALLPYATQHLHLLVDLSTQSTPADPHDTHPDPPDLTSVSPKSTLNISTPNACCARNQLPLPLIGHMLLALGSCPPNAPLMLLGELSRLQMSFPGEGGPCRGSRVCGFGSVSDGCVSLPAHPHSHAAGTLLPVTDPGPSSCGIFQGRQWEELKKKINSHCGNAQIHEVMGPVGR